MPQLLLTLMVAGCLLSPRPAPLSPGALASAAPAGQGSPQAPLVITPQTTIRRDGNLCPYEQIPAGAVVTSAEVAADRRTVLRIHFRSPR